MNLMGMSFRSFLWRNNPTSLTVSDERTLKETVLPYAGTKAEDLGRQKRRVTGEGYFVGDDCWTQWNALHDLYLQGGAGSLRLPGQKPFLAIFNSLKLIGAAGKNLLKYSFTFVETQSETEYDGRGAYTAKEGESLWDYAHRWNRSMDTLTAANPDLPDIGCLKAGERVIVP